MLMVEDETLRNTPLNVSVSHASRVQGLQGLFFILWNQGHLPVNFLLAESFDFTCLSRDSSDVCSGPLFPNSVCQDSGSLVGRSQELHLFL